MSVTLANATIFTPEEIVERGTLVASAEGKIVYVGSPEGAPRVGGPRLDLRGYIVAPGLIDIHVHGGHGITFGNLDNLVEELEDYSRWSVTHGVTGFLCTLAAPDTDTLLQMITGYVEFLEHRRAPGAIPLGLHLEGPYLSPEKQGAFNPAWLRRPSIPEVQSLLEAGKGWIRQATLAPELPHAQEVAVLLRQHGVVVALGHTNSDYETASAALRGNFTHVTHTFNAQRGFQQREPGALGAVLASAGVTAELIADTIHVHPAAMKVLLRCLGTDRVVLVTDALAAAGLGDGTYSLVGRPVIVKDGVARAADGALAGSSVTLDTCVRNIHQRVALPLHEAVKLASLNPARALGLTAKLGALEIGKEANLIVMDAAVHIYLTMVQGRIVYRNF